jgi:hypothetical protein
LTEDRLETLAARLAAERATEADVAGLRALLLDPARDATERIDFSRVADLNSQLPLAVIEISGIGGLSRSPPPCAYACIWIFRIGAAHRAPHFWGKLEER